MIFDTDVVIWAFRGNERAARAIDAPQVREISVVSYMELVQGALNKNELRMIREYLADVGFLFLPLSESIGQRASIYMEEYALSSAMGLPDALIASTAVEHQKDLCSGNAKHYRAVSELKLKTFKA